ncbi:hypothetical protein OKW12_001946 [Pseudomonas silensiensis]|nr:hypothetical protein [Pseudomonas silensiensis]
MTKKLYAAFNLMIFITLSFVLHADDGNETDGSIEMHGKPGNWVIVDPFGAVKRKAEWASPIIPVCWDEHPANDQEVYYRLVVKNAVNASWPKHSTVEFTGWEICKTKRDRGVHIVVRDQFPRTNGVGKYLDRRFGGVILNFQMQNWKSSCNAETHKDNCIRYIAIHEFGHVLGFVHEQVRSDAPIECTSEVDTSGAGGVRNLTEYDPQSIMNYCASIWDRSRLAETKAGAKLEPLTRLDKLAVGIYYGPNNIASTTLLTPE